MNKFKLYIILLVVFASVKSIYSQTYRRFN